MCDAIRASGVAVRCFLRGLPLFGSATPKTPLRVFGIIALDTLHVLRYARPVPRDRVRALALFLDFEGCANAAWDNKRWCRSEYQSIAERLATAGLADCLEAYLARLGALESRRPQIAGDQRHFDEVRSYREGVARLAIATAAAIALNVECGEAEIRAAHDDRDVDTLFRILMQCQIIDDVLDYREDVSAGLPSFLTACDSLPQALGLTSRAARAYARRTPSSDQGVFPLRIAQAAITTITAILIRAATQAVRVAATPGAPLTRRLLR